ncbi:MAG TPA: LPS assembly protein LptD, partial [Bryobacteraceae bacterium]|nr:LPS assembly protein LptD [Bryobacteraceae bacterium]
IETTEMILRADEIDYDENKRYAEARGNVKFDQFASGAHIEADKVEYDLEHETAKYYNVRGSSPAKIESRPGILTTSNPFSFEGKWAERIKNRYILHDGFVTNCKLPKPWWKLTGSEFDIVPGQRAIARRSVFSVRRVPLFYTPMFYKSLERAPRKSGFLTPNIGNSNRRGKMYGAGYYWAINRSYDATYRAQLFTQRGIAHHVDFRGKPNRATDFNFILYGVNDRGPVIDGVRRAPESGYIVSFIGRSDLKGGWIARADVNYLSSFRFRQAFTESYYEVISSEVHTSANVSKYWDTFSLDFVAYRVENFLNSDQKVSLRRLPSVEFRSRDRQVSDTVLPVWVSFQSSGSFVRRSELVNPTRQFVDRLDFEPRVMTALRWKDIHLIPSFAIRETHYGSSMDMDRRITGQGATRSSREFGAELILPSVARVFAGKRKHVIEPRASYRYVTGISNFDRYIRFDETELLSNTSEVEVSLTNRLYTKQKDGRVEETLSWTVAQRRFFDPTFGGALQEGRRNVLLSSATLTGYSFLDAARSYSPIVSVFRARSFAGMTLEWRADYDPKRGQITNSTVSTDRRIKNNMTVSVGHSQVRSHPILTPSANQLTTGFGYGTENVKGFSLRAYMVYDYRERITQHATTQISYNTDCCGYSVQYRRFGVGNRTDFRVAFAIANIGSFGTLRRQERMF